MSSIKFDVGVLTLERDLEDTLKRYQRQSVNQDDFDFDLMRCTWYDVLRELDRAQTAASESDLRGKKVHRRAWRALGTISGVLSPGLAAIPDNVGVLHGGLAVIFSVSKQLDKILT